MEPKVYNSMTEKWTQFQNSLIFAAAIVWQGIPPRLWRKAWAELHSRHLAEVRKAIWEAKKQGLVREDKDGWLWINESRGETK